jgi:hypothetical protein
LLLPLRVPPVLGWALLLPSELGSPLWQPLRPEPLAASKLMALLGSSFPLTRLASHCAAERSGRQPPNQLKKCYVHPLRRCR